MTKDRKYLVELEIQAFQLTDVGEVFANKVCQLLAFALFPFPAQAQTFVPFPFTFCRIRIYGWQANCT